MTNYELLETQTLSAASAGGITFTNIPQDGNSLFLRLNLRGETANQNLPFLIKFNSSTGNDYDTTFTRISSNSDSSFVYTDQPWMFQGYVPAATNASGAYGVTNVQLNDYTGSNYKTGMMDSVVTATANNNFDWFVIMAGATYKSSVAITTISITPNYSEFSAGSSISIYKRISN